MATSYIEHQILNRLIDKYEHSLVFKGTNKRNVQISLVRGKDKELNFIDESDFYVFETEYNNLIKKLVDLGFINYKKEKNREEISLRIDHIKEVYIFLGRKNLSETYHELIFSLYKIKVKSEIANKIIKFYFELLTSKMSFTSYFKDKEEMINLIKGVEEISLNEEEILLRNFSKKVFGNSKYLEKNQNKFVNLFNKFGDEEYSSFDEILEEHHIYKNERYTFIKGDIVFKINNQIINLKDLGFEFSLNSKEIEDMEIISIGNEKAITIENLTTFNYFSNDEYLKIYLSGFHNKDKENIINKINEFKKMKWFHFGDIDAGGFKIYLNLINKTGIDFSLYLMNKNVLEKYEESCEFLTKNDVKTLENLISKCDNEEIKETFEYMLKENIKLEQEAIKKEDFI